MFLQLSWRQAPVKRCTQVIVLEVKLLQPGGLAQAHELRFRAPRQGEEEPEMAQPHALSVTGLHQAVVAVLTHGFEIPIAPRRTPAIVFDDHQRLADKVGEHIQHLAPLDAVTSAHLLRRLQAPTAGEHRECGQHASFRL